MEKDKEIIFRGKSTHPFDIEYVKQNIPCQWGCPVLTDIPSYIEAIYRKDFDRAYLINKRANLLPGVLGRVCSRPCENLCRHGEPTLGEPVSICYLKRFASDNKTTDYLIEEKFFTKTGKKIAIVGSGPAGLSTAYSLRLLGHSVTIYEAMEKPGGMLYYGIPRFRLPEKILFEEIENLLEMGIVLKTKTKLGKDITINELLEKYDAVVLAMGCFETIKLNVPGEHLNGIYYGLDFMMRVNQRNYPELGDNLLVIGGGFTVIDCARIAKRMGVKNVTICIRRTENEMQVTKEEIIESKREGIKFLTLVSAVEIIGNGKVEGVRFKNNRLGRRLPSGKREIKLIEGSDFTVKADNVIIAIGQRPKTSDLKDNNLKFFKDGRTNVERLYISGDFATGSSTVIEAIANGAKVAEIIDRDLMNRKRKRKVISYSLTENTHRKRDWDFIKRTEMPTLTIEKRLQSIESEVELGFDETSGIIESKRCYLCNLKYEIYIPDCIYCTWCIEVCPRDCIEMVKELQIDEKTNKIKYVTTRNWNEIAGIVIDSSRCIRCGECFKICPMNCIYVLKVALKDELISKEKEV